MNRIFFVILLFPSLFFSQKESIIGIPLFDKNIRNINCPICKMVNKDAVLQSFNDSVIENLPEKKTKNPDYFKENKKYYLGLIQIYKNSPLKIAVLYHNLIALIEEDDRNYDFQLLKPEMANEYSELIDRMLALNISREIEIHFRRRRIQFIYDWDFLDKITESQPEENDDWYYNKDISLVNNLNWRGVAETYFNDTKIEKDFKPNRLYNGLNLGYNSFWSKNYFAHGVDVSYELVNEVLPWETFIRISTVGFSFVKDIKGDNSDFLFYISHLRQAGIFQINSAQFGYNQSSLGNSWFYRPEIGLSFASFNISYSYNFAFKKDMRDYLSGSYLKISLSYPLVRLGRY